MVKPRIWCWDLETSSLNANGGFIIAASVVDVSKPTKVIRSFRVDDYDGWAVDPWNDRELVRDLSSFLGTADTWITYYGKRFDAPFLSTRIVYWRSKGFKLDFLETVPHIDLYDTAKRRLRLHSNRLQVVSTLLGHGDKTPLDLPVWIKAAGGHKLSIDYIAKHCDKDSIILAKNYLALRPLIVAHPHIGMLSGGKSADSCPVCGGKDLQKRGTYTTPASKRQRLWCKACGKWSSSAYREIAVSDAKLRSRVDGVRRGKRDKGRVDGS